MNGSGQNCSRVLRFEQIRRDCLESWRAALRLRCICIALTVAIGLPSFISATAEEPTAPLPSPATNNPTTTPPTNTHPAESVTERLQKKTRIVADTNAPGDGPLKEKSFDWDWSWQGWNGLHLELTKRTLLGDPFASLRKEHGYTNKMFHLEQARMTSQIGARIAVDGAGFVTTGSLEDFDGGVELRRFRITARGDCILLLPVAYQIDLGYIPGQFNIEESYLIFRDLGFLGALKIGRYTTPFSLNAYTSSRDIQFMEAAGPVTALAPGVNAGMQFSRAVLDERMTWTMGLFGSSGNSGTDIGDASSDYGRAVIRLTGLPIARETPDDPSAQQLLHLGLNFNWLYSASSTVRYRTRPESHLAPYVLDTGDIDADSAYMFDFEAAWIHGPLSIQGEFIGGSVQQINGSKPTFLGFYAQTGWFLTGESRPYLRQEGRFGRLIPRHNFKWGADGWGAWEVVGRVSYTDLNSDNISGGRMGLVTAGVNWHPTSHIHWAFNFVTGNVDGPDGDGWINIFETRIEVDF